MNLLSSFVFTKMAELLHFICYLTPTLVQQTIGISDKSRLKHSGHFWTLCFCSSTPHALQPTPPNRFRFKLYFVTASSVFALLEASIICDPHPMTARLRILKFCFMSCNKASRKAVPKEKIK